jgi:excisionase family DNA binding protein
MSSTTEAAMDTLDKEKLLLKADEVARRLSLGRATVYLMMASGELPTFRRGRAVRVPARTHRMDREADVGRKRGTNNIIYWSDLAIRPSIGELHEGPN